MVRFSSKEPLMVDPGNLGALEIALAFGLVLYGIGLTQGYIYYRRSSNDRKFLKILVSNYLIKRVDLNLKKF